MEFKIALLPGDGIGPEILKEAVKVLEAIGEKFSHNFYFKQALIGGAAIDSTGDPFPVDTHNLCIKSDAVLLGTVGGYKYKNSKTIVTPEEGLLTMRKNLELYASLRHIVTFNSLIHKSSLKPNVIQGVDFLVVRELIGGIYFSEPSGRTEKGDTAYDSCVYSREEVVRVARLAFEYAKKRNKKLTVVDKASVLATSRLWREVIQEIKKDFVGVKLEFMFVDDAAMHIIQNPKDFDVILTENMFGDILTGQSSVITGSLGLLPSASIGVHTSVFRPIHGACMDIEGKDIANPIGSILSAALMLEYAFDLKQEANIIREAVSHCLNNGIVTQDIAKGQAYSTGKVGDWLVNYILK